MMIENMMRQNKIHLIERKFNIIEAGRKRTITDGI